MTDPRDPANGEEPVVPLTRRAAGESRRAADAAEPAAALHANLRTARSELENQVAQAKAENEQARARNAQLQAELRRTPSAPLTVLARRIVLRRLPLHDRALRAVASRPLQVEFHPFAPAKAANGTGITRHRRVDPP